MNASPHSADPAEIREAILDAALARLLQFGYQKTTIADIADAAGMSSANLYRYFENKQDILAECTARCIDERLERLRVIVGNAELSAAQKLTRYALELVDDSHELAGAESMIGELVDTMTSERSDLLHSKHEIHHELIADILASGNAGGEFQVDDVESTARIIFSSFFMFDVPLFVGLYSRAEFDERARGIVSVLVDGLTVKHSNATSTATKSEPEKK